MIHLVAKITNGRWWWLKLLLHVHSLSAIHNAALMTAIDFFLPCSKQKMLLLDPDINTCLISFYHLNHTVGCFE